MKDSTFTAPTGETYIKIGHLQKSTGTQGHLKFKPETGFDEVFFQLEVLFLYYNGHMTPFFLEEIEESSCWKIKLEEIDSKEAAADVSDHSIYFFAEAFDTSELPNPDEYYRLKGKIIVDETAGEVGMINDIVEMPEQILAQVHYNDKDILIPLNDTLMTRAKGNTIYMDLPEGLLDL